jgi:hypothetical protein
MALRIAWACYPRDIGLGIAANVFVYVGTIILFLTNWFFVQRVVRAQHQRLGWSTPYRILHRGALVVLVISLIMLILVNIWQFFTLNATKLHVFRALQLTGQTYFTIFCFAPVVLVLVSVLIPRTEVEKFGAGRLRANITILLVATIVLTTGQLFRCVVTWIPQTPLRNAAGQPVDEPWYLHKACFYVFNFVTEMVVIIMFAVVRVDLRFHVPNGSRMSGDYSGRNSRINLHSSSNLNSNLNSTFNVSVVPKKMSLACETPVEPVADPEHNVSCETLHQYQTSIFEDSRTLADSLAYSGSTLEVNDKTGVCKVKRSSTGSSSRSIKSSRSPTRSSFHDKSVTFADEAPPVPQLPTEWPLPNTHPPRGSTPTIDHSNPPSRRGTPMPTFEIPKHDMNGADVGGAISDALAALEANSEQSQRRASMDPIRQSSASIQRSASGTALNAGDKRPSKLRHNPLAPRNRATFPPKSAIKPARSSNTMLAPTNSTPTIVETPELPPPPATPHNRRSSSVELITLSQRPTSPSCKLLDLSLQGEIARDPVSTSDEIEHRAESSGSSSATYTNSTTSSDAREVVSAEEEFRRFSYDAFPTVPRGNGRGRSVEIQG